MQVSVEEKKIKTVGKIKEIKFGHVSENAKILLLSSGARHFGFLVICQTEGDFEIPGEFSF